LFSNKTTPPRSVGCALNEEEVEGCGEETKTAAFQRFRHFPTALLFRRRFGKGRTMVFGGAPKYGHRFVCWPFDLRRRGALFTPKLLSIKGT
jgi:hypothetical protein